MVCNIRRHPLCFYSNYYLKAVEQTEINQHLKKLHARSILSCVSKNYAGKKRSNTEDSIWKLKHFVQGTPSRSSSRDLIGTPSRSSIGAASMGIPSTSSSGAPSSSSSIGAPSRSSGTSWKQIICNYFKYKSTLLFFISPINKWFLFKEALLEIPKPPKNLLQRFLLTSIVASGRVNNITISSYKKLQARTWNLSTMYWKLSNTYIQKKS